MEPTRPGPVKQSPPASGTMSSGGTTNEFRIPGDGLDPADKKVLCSAICQCTDMPGIGKDGRSLKQACVSGRLKGLDETLGHRSRYKPEVTYDMTKRPPAPIMDKAIQTRPRELWPGWTKILWPKDPEHPVPYQPGVGNTRRPDVVIVKDPAKPPTQDNIEKVVEIKFPGDPIDKRQLGAYATIAGHENKVIALTPNACGCGAPKEKKAAVPANAVGTGAAFGAAARLLYFLVAKRPPPIPAPAP